MEISFNNKKSTKLQQYNYNVFQDNFKRNPLLNINLAKFDVLCENCYDILGHPSGNWMYSEQLGYYSMKNGRLNSYFNKMNEKYLKKKLKFAMNSNEKAIYNRLCTCGVCRKCLSNY